MQRRVDRRILIPTMEKLAPDDFALAAAFALHMAYDTAWHACEWEFDEWERNFLDRLMLAGGKDATQAVQS